MDNLQKKENIIDRKRPPGVIVFAILLILSTLIWSMAHLNYDYYRTTVRFLPEASARSRYFISIINRFLVLASAVGILFLKDIFRKMGLLLCFLTVCVIPWKHPFFTLKDLAEKATQQILSTIPPIDTMARELVFKISLWSSVAIVYIIDIGFAVAFIYYFTRPRVKALFD